MSSERAGTPTGGALNREKAREVLDRERQPYDGDVDDLITELEACVVPDPRLARIEALLTGEDYDYPTTAEASRALWLALRGALSA